MTRRRRSPPAPRSACGTPPPRWRSCSLELGQCLVELQHVDVGGAQEPEFGTLRLADHQMLEHGGGDPGGVRHHRNLHQGVLLADVGVVPAARGGDEIGRRVDATRLPVGHQGLRVRQQGLGAGPQVGRGGRAVVQHGGVAGDVVSLQRVVPTGGDRVERAGVGPHPRRATLEHATTQGITGAPRLGPVLADQG